MTVDEITATPDVVFEGHPVGAGGKATCAGCHCTIREGDPVGVYAYKTCDSTVWDVARLYCAGCRRSKIPHPTLGATELLLHARLAVTSDAATQTARLTLRSPETVSTSPAGAGGDP